jgi:hypothetical protein
VMGRWTAAGVFRMSDVGRQRAYLYTCAVSEGGGRIDLLSICI